jgi:hypothetical protein
MGHNVNGKLRHIRTSEDKSINLNFLLVRTFEYISMRILKRAKTFEKYCVKIKIK